MKLRDRNPETYPIINHPLLAARDDVDVLIEGCKITRKILQAGPFKAYLSGERMPGTDVNSNDEWEDYLRIIDASIMPTIPSGNTNGPTMMIIRGISYLL